MSIIDKMFSRKNVKPEQVQISIDTVVKNLKSDPYIGEISEVELEWIKKAVYVSPYRSSETILTKHIKSQVREWRRNLSPL